MNFIYLLNSAAVSVFGIILSASFCGIAWTKRKHLLMTGSMAVILMFQGVIYFWVDPDLVEYIYPLITHLPLAAVLCGLSRKILWPTISVLTAYLCCQVRRWLALLMVTVFSGGSLQQNVAELALTLPLLLLLLWLIAPSMQAIARYTPSAQYQFGFVPALYYGFDYLTGVYTDLLREGITVAVEFMPFICSVLYLIFVFYFFMEQRVRGELEQTQENLNMQVVQAVREIKALREAQQKTRAYRHDMRHHMQYLLSCIENGRLEQAQEYIHQICLDIEANQVTAYCENEAANLIFSSFAGRLRDCGISVEIRTAIPQDIPVSESDLCVLLSNALENALHACQKLKEKGQSGMVQVLAYEKNGKIFIQIINSCDEDIVFEDGIPVTNNPGHGIGVRSICAIVERYEGIYAFAVKDGQFILRISL